ncbi:sensor histidine kinase [Streptomyces sp. ACA25]|uniref:sensor histidine kinase n=1 Tax=Streptomyces sp. ACA25 TaxID=3022596 RepID=UPI00230798BD|nr:sensor histidine kinase [Streptomyces sp. ACA25]MDB1087574.1 sensor histidine kinase [Streptomyces sp. ACA25]
MRKKTLHDPADPPPSAPAGDPSASPRGPRARVRNRLLAGVALTAVAVLAAGAPVVLGAAQDLSRSQQAAEAAELSRQAVSLAHTLADERDALVLAQMTDTPEARAEALTDSARARADRRAEQLRPDAPRSVAERLDTLAETRELAVSGTGTPAEVHTAYTAVIEELDGLTRAASLARPDRASGPEAAALPDLVRAVDASAATRTLLVAGLLGEGPQQELAGLAQRTHAREAAALQDFTGTAGSQGRESYQRTVTGPEVQAAEEQLSELTAQPYLTDEARELDPAAVSALLSARTELQRGVLSSLTTAQVHSAEQLRDSEVTALQLRIALVAAALLLALAVSVHTARSLTRPLAAVRLGSRRVAADPAGQEPLRYTGRNDEFAEVVAAVNALHARAVSLQQEATEASEDRGGLREEHGRLAAERDRLRSEQQELSERLALLHGAVHGTFAHHAQRILTLVSDQLAVIERLEEQETDPDRLSTLFALDHLAARVRRHSENLLLLAGAERAAEHPEPVPLVDVLRAAVSEIERYDLAELEPLPPPVRIAGHAARDITHLLSELLDNAAAFSPADTRVRITGHLGEDRLTLSVTDDGIGMTNGRLTELNERLSDPGALPPPGADGDPGVGMGLYTVARLASRHGLRTVLRARPEGGIAAEVQLPRALVQADPEPVDLAPLPGSSAADPAGPAPAASPEGGAEHSRAADSAAAAEAAPPARTDGGLPVRSRAAAPSSPELPAARSASAAVDPEDLRQRLGGFQRGSRAGHRDAGRPPGPEAGEEVPS